MAESVNLDPVSLLHVRRVVVSEGNPRMGTTKLCNRRKKKLFKDFSEKSDTSNQRKVFQGFST